MSTLQAVWQEIEQLLAMGISVIPVRDKDDEKNVAKSPYAQWKQYQTAIIVKEQLWFEMEKFGTTAIGIIGGKVSGNLEIIDIDVKYKPGIDATLFTDLKKLYPDLFNLIRIHKSPSGGFHILYRCEEPIEGNQKLAGRPATPDELAKNKKQKTYNFLETRGEGGYVVCPPSLGYKVAKDCPIPLFTKHERDSLISFCRSYNELIIPAKKESKPTKADNDYYEENPFDDFNARVDPDWLMGELGWKEHERSHNFIWYTRPDKSKGVSMSFNLSKRFFYCFTASTELEEGKGYSPSILTALLMFNDDRKKLCRWLVGHGYGKIRQKIEIGIAKKAAVRGKDVPKNFSDEGMQAFKDAINSIQINYPHGIFWDYDEEQKLKINRERLYEVSGALGFRLYKQDIVFIDGWRLARKTERFYFDIVKAYIKEEDADFYNEICNTYESFIQKNGTFTITRLPLLDEQAIITDTDIWSYKFYQNGYIFITCDQIIVNNYDNLSGLVWEDKVMDRSFVRQKPSGRFVEFLEHSVNLSKQADYIQRCIGYLCHDHKDETTGYIIVLTEECPDPKQGGGTGKNIFSNLLQYSITYINIPGSQVRFDEKFLQSWSYQRILAISDVPRKFDFSFLKELSTGSGLLKKLFKDEESIPVHLMPKFIIQTNFSYEITDGGLKRRIMPIEFTDFFTRSAGVDTHFGCHFPNGWTNADWFGYDNFIAESIQSWLAGGRKLSSPHLSSGGTLKQFDQTFGQLTREFIEQHWPDWSTGTFFSNESFKNMYAEFCGDNNISLPYRLSSIKMNAAMRDWADMKGFVYIKDEIVRSGPMTTRGRLFIPKAPF